MVRVASGMHEPVRASGGALRALLACAVLALAIALLGAASAHAQATPATSVLVFQGPSNPTNDAGVDAIEALGADHDFAVTATVDPTEFTPEKLAAYDAVVFLNSSGDRLNAAQEEALQGFIENGGGFVGIGTSAEAEPGVAFFGGLIGARPDPASPGATTEQTVVAGDRVHPATRDLPLLLNRSDVWYRWQTRPTGTVHTVARYHAPGAAAGDGTDVGGTDHPISWCRDYEGGRSFYTGMGRTAASYGEAQVKTHLLGGIEWAAGMVRADCKATIDANYKGTRLVSAGPENTGLATSGESHGVVVAPNGWVLYIGRGDCRTDAARGALLGGNPFGRIFDHADPRVGLGCGSVHIWDPAQYNGAVNSGVKLAGTLAVYGDGGQGGERTDQADHKMEWGLLGITVAPDFAQTGHIYLQYFPSFDPTSKPAGLAESFRIRKMSKPRISRFTINLQTKQLDLDSEVKIFEYDSQIYSCCHVGGGMGFDSAGNLYVTTGDTNSSQGSNGYSGNNPAAKCPTGPPTQASSAHCGDNGISYQDARRTAGNTNDYNGKMLRIKPIPTLPDGVQPPVGPGSTYTLPTASDPNGANLFDGTEGGGGKAKPEIYAMGLRNPSRLSIDPKTDVPYAAWVGPDAGAPSVTQGPSTYENAAQISHAGNYGWPYCMGNAQAYRDRVVDPTAPNDPAKTQLRGTNAPGYVSGGPATGGTDGWYDCNNIHNDSPNNTGLTDFPHQTGTGKDAGKMRPTNLWYSRGNPDNDGNPQTNTSNGCPSYPRDRGAGNAPNYGAVPQQLCPYAVDSGMTIMDGPVYRYDKNATDNSRRWPEYWDGRWFLHNNGGASIKHAVLLDPATDQDGGQPVYADSLRSALSWQAGYMDSKFGPDGALYVQVYDGFFRAGTNAGIYRFDYIGGAPTPGANPKGTAVGNFQVRFSSAGSGGVSYAWEFGDGQTSTEANPTHTYTEAKRYTAKLTVTYADGGTDSKTVTVDVLAEPDDEAPVTTATLDPAEPGSGGTYTRPVTVTLSATDSGGSGLDRIEYRVNGGEFLTYTGPIKRSQQGAYTIDYRAVDRFGNVEANKQVTFTIAAPENCPTNLDDEFNGTALDPKWQVLRRDDNLLSFANGKLRMKIATGTDMIGGTATAKNVLLQDAPAGSWVAQTKLDPSQLTDGGEQAGLILWNSEGQGANTFAKITYIEKGANRQFEWVATRNSAQQISTGPSFQQRPSEVYLRVSANGGGTYVAEASFDGETWEQIAGDITNLGNPDTIKVGLKSSDGAGPGNTVAFDHFRVDCSDKVPPTTTAVVTPDKPDGELGWYKTAPSIALEADDGDTGEVAKIEYRIDGGATQTYEEGHPFTIGTPGDHTVEYFATDAADEPNTESPKTVQLRVDSLAPVTSATLDPAAGAEGPVRVTLDPQDGDAGSGSALTQYRVDGGPWQTYAAEDDDVLFDGTQESLRLWAQAGGGRFELLDDGSGGITPVGGLGMLWFPQKEYRDFRFKFQFREGTQDYSNGGAFVRFPDPRTPLAERTDQCAKTGNAASDQAWVAIYCGHEIQLYDGTGTESQKTGSIYNFDPNGIDEIGEPSDIGEWNDYEVEVIGQHYRISRNGEVINEFENSPGQPSSRPGDPPTELRQFAQGFVGLQNHGGPDVMQYRDIRVEDLSDDRSSEGATGPFTVSGAGPHTVEFRSFDVAGNMEAKKTVDFEIGRTTPPGSTGPSGTTPPAGDLPPMIETPATYKLGNVAGRMTATRFAKRGIKVAVTCTGAMSGTAKLTVSAATARKLKLSSRTLGSRDVRCWGAHTATVTLKPSKSRARKLARGKGSIKLQLSVRMLDFGSPARTTTKTITLRR